MSLRGFEIVKEYQNKNISLPVRKTACSAGYDIEAAADYVIHPGEVVLVATGLKAYMQDDEYLGLHVRSSLAIKQKIAFINCQGIIDADYYNNPKNEGHIMLALVNHGSEDVKLKKGMRVAQGIFYKYLVVDGDEAGKGAVRDGGFGSTGA